MKYSVEELRNNDSFKLLHQIEYSDIISFVIRNIRRINLPTTIYFASNLILLLLVISFILSNIVYGNISWGKFFLYILFGFFGGSILIVPIHELLHGLIYKLAGAKKIRFGVIWEYLAFYVAADDFVSGKITISFVAITPFLIITSGFLTAYYLCPDLIRISFLFAALMHSTMCIGDFAILSYFSHNKDKEIYTFDESDKKISYFYEKTE